jgi:hypothetical protein
MRIPPQQGGCYGLWAAHIWYKTSAPRCLHATFAPHRELRTALHNVISSQSSFRGGRAPPGCGQQHGWTVSAGTGTVMHDCCATSRCQVRATSVSCCFCVVVVAIEHNGDVG